MEPASSTPAPLARPLAWVAAALAAGSWVGLAHPRSAAAAALALACLLGVWIGARIEAGASPRPRYSRLLALGALFLLSDLRASRLAPPPPRQVLTSAESAAAAFAPLEGRWQPRQESAAGAWGVLVPARGEPSLELPAGAVRAGEAVRILPGGAPRHAARGPVERGGERPPTLRVRCDEIVRLAPAETPVLGVPVMALRARLLERTGALEDPQARGLARALVCGDTSLLDGDLTDLFRRTGLAHVLSVSGMHVWLVHAALIAPLVALLARAGSRREGRRRFLEGLASCAAIALYVPLSGGAAPVRRAALAIGLALLARFVPARGLRDAPSGLGRGVDALSLWSAALAAECALDPRTVQSPSAQLSYAAALGLIAGTGPLARAIRARAPAPRPRLGPRRPAAVDFVLRAREAAAVRLASWSTTALAASVAAVLASLPFAWAHFGEWSPLGIPATSLVALPILLLIALGWAEGAAPGMVPDAWIEGCARGLVGLLASVDALPSTPLPLPPRPAWLVLAAVLATFWALRDREALSSASRRLAAAAWALVLLPWSAAPSGLEVHALDVGHGSAVVLRAPGLPALVFDCGARDRAGPGTRALAPLLAAWEVDRPFVVLSHLDRDHWSGLAWLVERCPPVAWVGALPAPLAERLPHTVPRLDLAEGEIRLPAGRALEDGGLELRLHRGVVEETNEGSRTLDLRWGGHRVVLFGDCEQEGLRRTLGSPGFAGPCSLVLWPHHGSDTPWLSRLLESLSPREIWVSAGSEPGVAAELDRRGLSWRSTWAMGPLTWKGRHESR